MRPSFDGLRAFRDYSDVGEEIGAPCGSEPSGDLAICRGGPEFALGAVVVRGDVRVVEEGEEMITNLAVSSAQSSAVAVDRLLGDREPNYVEKPPVEP